MQADRRLDFRSALPGTELVYRMAPARPEERRYLLGVAENVSLGGMFIAARHPFPAGTLVCIDLYPGGGAGDTQPFSARAVVRWRRLWREPRGMGLQFLDFANLGERSMTSLLDRVLFHEPAVWQPGADLLLA